MMADYIILCFILACDSAPSVRNLASTTTTNRHRPLQPCNYALGRLKALDEGGHQANQVSSMAGSGRDRRHNERETTNISLFRTE